MMTLPETTGFRVSKPIEQINPVTGEVIKEWSSIREASTKLKITKHYMSSALRDNNKKAGGFGWRYK